MEDFRESLEKGYHKQLMALEGSWEGPTKTWLQPDAEADESINKSTFRSVLDGRFALQEYEDTVNGEPHVGVTIFGYNLDAGRFEFAWVDSFHAGTSIMFSEGNCELSPWRPWEAFPTAQAALTGIGVRSYRSRTLTR